jgi:hypothetical protein
MKAFIHWQTHVEPVENQVGVLPNIENLNEILIIAFRGDRHRSDNSILG